MVKSDPNKADVCIVAAEASSALYAQRLLEFWRSHQTPVRTFGVGSTDMEAMGFERLGRSEDLAVVGIAEVLKHYKHIKSVFYALIEQIRIRQPKFVLLMDYPDFNLRLAKEIKKLGVPVVYYISPQVWAWRKSRINTIKKYVDRMLVVLPFEKDFYAQHGVPVVFVGHPLLDEMARGQLSVEDRWVERRRYGIKDNEILVGLMPGSRQSELKNHFLAQVRAAEIIYRQRKDVKFALLVAPSFSLEEFRHFLPNYEIPLQLIRDEPLRMVGLTDVVLCASGTATLVVGLLLKPMVIMYRMNPISALLARLFVRGTAHFGLINLVLGARVVPELFQNSASPENLSVEILKFINDKALYAKTVDALRTSHDRLGQRGATERVAAVLGEYLKV